MITPSTFKIARFEHVLVAIVLCGFWMVEGFSAPTPVYTDCNGAIEVLQ